MDGTSDQYMSINDNSFTFRIKTNQDQSRPIKFETHLIFIMVLVEFKLDCSWENPSCDYTDYCSKSDFETNILITLVVEYPTIDRYLKSKKNMFTELFWLGGGLTMDNILDRKFVTKRHFSAYNFTGNTIFKSFGSVQMSK